MDEEKWSDPQPSEEEEEDEDELDDSRAMRVGRCPLENWLWE